jgi:Skp family chaperone for outer membrane proteins
MSNRIRLSLFAAASFMALVLIALFATQAWPTAAAPDGAPKIAVIDTEKILLSSATGKNALAALKKSQEQAEAEAKTRIQEIKDLQTKIQNGQSLPASQLAELKKQLDEKEAALRRWQDDAKRDLDKKRDNILAEIDKKVMPHINQIAKESGYTLIFRKFESGLIYADDAIEITAAVIQRLDGGATTGPIDTTANRNVGAGTATPGVRPDLFMVTPAGNVGIGTTSPTTNVGRVLHIDSLLGSQLHLTSGTKSGARAGDGSIISHFTDNNLFITNQEVGATIFFNNEAERMRISSNGRVGIGTAAPDQLLSVNGEASKVGGGSWQSFSDERLKNIKGGFNIGLNAVMQLEPIRYEYKRDNALGLKSVGEHIGFGAQALQKVIPEAVSKNADGYLMVNNDPIIWTMLNAIKEQQKEIAALKEPIRKSQASSQRRRK